MTLSTVPRYDPDQPSQASGHAVVLGASMAGLLSARVLSDWFESVTVVDRDSLPNDPVPRDGVPQGRHVHVLQEAGRATIEDLFPGFGERLLSAGGLLITDHEIGTYAEGGFLANSSRRQSGYSATRPLYELLVRREVAALDGVSIRPDCQFVDYLVGDGATRVNGVVVKNSDTEEELDADLVVDATGRTSRTPKLLAEYGYRSPPVDEVHVDMLYSTAFLERPPGDRRGVNVLPAPDRPRGSFAFPVEGDRWVVTLWGAHDDDPPTDPAGLAEYAGSLPVPHVQRLLEEQPLAVEEIAQFPFPSNRRRRYEALDRFPDGLVVIGDAIASFNPIYGQGMSIAALEALQLHHALANGGRENLALRFFDSVEVTVDLAWNMAVGSDHQFEGTEGPKPRGADLLNWYLFRLIRAAHTDPALADAFLRVQFMERPPTHLLRPGIVWRVFNPLG